MGEETPVSPEVLQAEKLIKLRDELVESGLHDAAGIVSKKIERASRPPQMPARRLLGQVVDYAKGCLSRVTSAEKEVEKLQDDLERAQKALKERREDS
eukprot:1190315-Alexandrium_andersonii.AAC.1